MIRRKIPPRATTVVVFFRRTRKSRVLVDQFDGLNEHFCWNIIFGWKILWHFSNPEFEDNCSTLKFYGDTSTGRVSTKMCTKFSETPPKKNSGKFGHAPFFPSNHTERWISQPIFPKSQSPLDDFQTTFSDLHKIQHVWLHTSNIYIYVDGPSTTLVPFWGRKLKVFLNLPMFGSNQFKVLV